MAENIQYFISKNNDYYINYNGDFYIANITYDDAPTTNSYLKYKTYINQNGKFQKYTAYIRKADGSYVKVNPYIYAKIDIAVAGLAIAGLDRVSSANK